MGNPFAFRQRKTSNVSGQFSSKWCHPLFQTRWTDACFWQSQSWFQTSRSVWYTENLHRRRSEDLDLRTKQTCTGIETNGTRQRLLHRSKFASWDRTELQCSFAMVMVTESHQTFLDRKKIWKESQPIRVGNGISWLSESFEKKNLTRNRMNCVVVVMRFTALLALIQVRTTFKKILFCALTNPRSNVCKERFSVI